MLYFCFNRGAIEEFMPGGNKNIKPSDGKQFSKDYQPKRYRQSTKFLTEAIIKGLGKKRDVIIEGICVETGVKRKIRITNPTQDIIINALLRKAASGDISAVREILDRTEGKPIFTAEVNLPGVQHIGFEESE